jgi:hypothetical protein
MQGVAKAGRADQQEDVGLDEYDRDLEAIEHAHRGNRRDSATLREVLLNGSIVVLLGAFAIGWITGADGLKSIAPFIMSG